MFAYVYYSEFQWWYRLHAVFIFVILQQMIEEEEEQFAAGEFFNCNCCKFFAVFKFVHLCSWVSRY